MRNFKMTIEYDGTDFSGWQIQPDQRTVQGELYGALERLGGDDTLITGAGRTDAGVHATGQVASVRIDTRLSADELSRMRLSTVDALFDAEHPKTTPVLPATSLATVGQPGAGMRD